MSWTDERVETLRKLFEEGHSAAQIAKQLGGVTRNAVIGKLHRLGLSSKSQTQAAKPEPAKPAKPAPQPKEPTAEAPKPKPKPAAKPAPAAAAPIAPVTTIHSVAPPRPANRDPGRREPQPISEDRLELLARLAEMEKDCKRIPLLELNERVCKWPIGDPTDEDFCFCGLPAVPGKPYCGAHVAAAFQPMSNRRDRNRSK